MTPDLQATILRIGTNKQATLVCIGLPQLDARAELELNPFFDKRTRILVSHGGDHLPAVDFPRLAGWALDGELDGVLAA